MATTIFTFNSVNQTTIKYLRTMSFRLENKTSVGGKELQAGIWFSGLKKASIGPSRKLLYGNYT